MGNRRRWVTVSCVALIVLGLVVPIAFLPLTLRVESGYELVDSPIAPPLRLLSRPNSLEYIKDEIPKINPCMNCEMAWGYTWLMLAVQAERPDVAKWLIENGANPDGESSLTSPLHLAIGSDNPLMVYSLLEHGADPLHDFGDGKTPLAQAVKLNRENSVFAIRNYLADRNLQDPTLDSPPNSPLAGREETNAAQ